MARRHRKVSDGGWETAHSGKCLQREQGDPGSESQDPGYKASGGSSLLEAQQGGTRDRQIPEVHWPTSQASSISFQFGEGPCLKTV